MFVWNKNGYMLMDALFGLFVMLLCASLLMTILDIVHDELGVYIDEKINTEWFYAS